MPALRCSFCSTNWPEADDYVECPECESPTRRGRNLKAIPKAEARSRKNHADFERFYEEWDSQRSPERLEPDYEECSQV